MPVCCLLLHRSANNAFCLMMRHHTYLAPHSYPQSQISAQAGPCVRWLGQSVPAPCQWSIIARLNSRQHCALTLVSAVWSRSLYSSTSCLTDTSSVWQRNALLSATSLSIGLHGGKQPCKCHSRQACCPPSSFFSTAPNVMQPPYLGASTRVGRPWNPAASTAIGTFESVAAAADASAIWTALLAAVPQVCLNGVLPDALPLVTRHGNRRQQLQILMCGLTHRHAHAAAPAGAGCP